MKLYRFNELKVYQALQDKNKFNISEDLYYKLICADPTNKPNYKELQLDIKKLDIEKVKEINQGKYFQWIIKQYKDEEKIFLEDFDKIYSTLELFNKFNTKLQNRDINQYKDLGSIYSVVKQFDPDNQEVEFTNEEEQKLVGQFKVVFKNDYCRIIIPLTLEASKYFAQGTEWCTQYPDSFKTYTGKQTTDITEHNLYILYTENPEDRLQFHFGEKQFMDINDSEIEIEHFMEEHKDIYEFFNKHIKVNKFIQITFWKESNFGGCPSIIEGDFYCYNNNLTTLNSGPKIVEGNFDCSRNNLTTLNGGPEIVEGDYVCSKNILVSLKGASKIIEGTFNCSNNQLTSLEGAPHTVKGWFNCGDNKLTNLKGAPYTVTGGFICNSNQLITLDGSPKIVRNFWCSYNKLTNLVGSPQTVDGSFFCNDNQLTSLEGVPEIVNGHFHCYNNNLSSLSEAPTIVGNDFYCSGNPNLSKEEILKYKATGAVKGTIYSDHGSF